MSKLKLKSFEVKRYRSIVGLKLNLNYVQPTIICGENNIGKTNFLRALNLFFNHFEDESLFDAKRDIPHHIYFGSQGSRTNTELTGIFEEENTSFKVSAKFKEGKNIEYKLDGKKEDRDTIQKKLKAFRFLYIKSNNIDLPKLISEILEKEALMPLDKKRAKQSRPLKKLTEFIELSQDAISDIEKDINQYFEKLVNFDGILNNKRIKINFAEYEKLRHMVKNMTTITISDGNEHGIASKGSGAQRAVFIALMQYIANNSKNSIIWGIDEPEVFLQPKLQRKFAQEIHEVVKNKEQPVLLTTHSQHFINIESLDDTHVFTGKVEPKAYKRKPGQMFFETKTENLSLGSDYKKAQVIKEHLGIKNNDGWEVLPFNLLVEGEEDKKYLETLMIANGLEPPNIIWAGGASKFAGLLQYYNLMSDELEFKPKFICIFDNDSEGRSKYDQIKGKNYQNIDTKTVKIPRHDGKAFTKYTDWEIEDFIPQEQLILTINQILKKEGYSIISAMQRDHRTKPANIDTQCLNYAEICSAHNNSEKEKIIFDGEGRKKQICMMFCKTKDLASSLNHVQIEFLTTLVS